MAWACSTVPGAVHCIQKNGTMVTSGRRVKEAGKTTDLEQSFEPTNFRSAEKDEG